MRTPDGGTESRGLIGAKSVILRTGLSFSSVQVVCCEHVLGASRIGSGELKSYTWGSTVEVAWTCHVEEKPEYGAGFRSFDLAGTSLRQRK